MMMMMRVGGDVVVCGDEEVEVGKGAWITTNSTLLISDKALERYVVTLPGSRNVTVQRFRNPAGYVFDTIVMRRMNDIPGNSLNAPLHSEHTWFMGYAWTPLACDESHLGWKFVRTSARHDAFYLIVLSQIRYVDTKKWTYVWNPTTRSFVSQTRGQHHSRMTRQDYGSKWREL